MIRLVLSGLLLLPLCVIERSAPSDPGKVGDPPCVPVNAPPPMAPALSHLVDSLHILPEAIRFRVEKSSRLFKVFGGDILLKSYPCVLGEVPVGDKYHQGDRKTPEGTFAFRGKRVHPDWHKFIWVDYPNDESWRRFKARKAEGSIPAGKDIGGEIGIHGVPEGYDHWIDAGQDWTWGCIALKNKDVDEIYPYVILRGTLMEVVP